MSSQRPRVVVTGAGAVTPAGASVAATHAAVMAAEPAAAPIERWDASELSVRFAAGVTDADPDRIIGPRELRRIDRVSLLGIVAAAEALSQAGLAGRPPAAPDRASVIVGSGVGGILTLEEQILTRSSRGPDRVSPMLIPMMMANATAGLIAIRHGLRGPAESVATACASGASSIGAAMWLIRTGRADLVVAGGAEAAITPTAMAGFARMGALSTRNEDPAGASRPFDAGRDGFVMGEGAGILVLESDQHARSREAEILGEVAGYGATCDASHITAPDETGAGAVSCMRQALRDAGISPGDITHVNAHGTSTPLNDAAEATALGEVFADACPPVTSTKGVTGHLIGAAGAVEAILALTAARSGSVPPVANLSDPDVDDRANLVLAEPVTVPPGPVLSNSFGFGGHNASLVLAPGPGLR